MAEYELVTIWRVGAPIEHVWHEIFHAELWPSWWQGVVSVEDQQEGDAQGIGAVRRFTWKSRLPHSLTFDAKVVRVEAPVLLEASVSGELQGSGLWQLSSEGDDTMVRYDWKVSATKAWMRLLAPVARPLFAWNHNVVMGWGAEGLAKGPLISGAKLLLPGYRDIC